MNKDNEADDIEDNLAEYDYMLKEYAGDIIPSLALCYQKMHLMLILKNVLSF
jgi:hypothetical protein